jgi:hypothetical protein
VIKGLFARRVLAKKANRLVPVGKLNIQRELDMIQLEYDASQTEMMLESCCQNKVTFNGFLCACFLLSVIEEFETADENGKKDIALPMVTAVNMRRFLKEPARFKNAPGMFASILETTHVLNNSTDIWDLARDINNGIAFSKINRQMN